MAMQRLNMVEQMSKAWDEKKRLDVEIYQQHCKNLMSHGFAEIEDIFKEYYRSKGYTYNNEVFYIFQRIIVFLMKCDDEFLQGEYDTYCLICKWAGIEALDVQDVNDLYRRTSMDKLCEDIDLITSLREMMDPDKYNALILSFCYLSLMGDTSFDENEYYIIRCFYKPGFDYVPATWQQFKNEW